MFSRDLPIDIMRIVSLNRVRKIRSLFDSTARRNKTLCLEATATRSSIDQLRSIRKRAAGAEDPSPADSPVRTELIARIRAAIAEGRYHVSAAHLAQKLIDNMLANQPPKL